MVQDLLKGFQDFKRRYYTADSALMPRLVEEGQTPRYFVISCIDSRSNPGTVFNALPGTFFAHKAMGAIVRPYKHGTALAAALHFALEYNAVDHIIVLGHTQCGAMQALAEKLDDPEIYSFIEVAHNALERAKKRCTCADTILEATVEETVLESIQNLETYPSVAKALEAGKVTIKPWIFDMQNSHLLEYDPDQQKFVAIDEE